MSEQRLIVVLKVFIVMGLCLMLLGHYLLSYYDLPAKWGISGMMVSAGCIALGLIFSLPTKMYLTFILVRRESELSEAESKLK